MWQVVRNVLGSREQREVQLALETLRTSVQKLQTAEAELTPEDRELARYYLEQIAHLQSFFQIAQLALQTVVGKNGSLDFDTVTKIEIG